MFEGRARAGALRPVGLGGLTTGAGIVGAFT